MDQPFHILVADDEVTIRLPLKVLLGRLPGVRLTMAADGDAAMTAAMEGAWDLAMLDVMMPGCDGYSICRAIRDRWDAASRPVWMLTARNSQMDTEVATQIGANRFILKPFDPDELSMLVRREIEVRAEAA